MSPERLVEVALPLPLRSTFSYRVPAAAETPARGVRVLVPFGPRRVIGVALGRGAPPPAGEAKELLEVVDEGSLPPPPLLDLAAWVSEHYLAPPGECYRLAFPPAGVRASRSFVRLASAPAAEEADPVLAALAKGPLALSTLAHRLGRDPSGRLLKLRAAGRVLLEQSLRAPGFREARLVRLVDPAASPRGSTQRRIVERLASSGGSERLADLVRERPSWRGAVERLAGAGVVRLELEREVRSPDVMAGGRAQAPELTPAQSPLASRFADAVAARRFQAFLLHGITGSGKTELYFHAIQSALDAGLGGLLLVPEIALTPLLMRAAGARFGATVAVQHSELSAGERHDQWWRIREGEARVVVGARSAVFAPVAELGLVVVDEEHDGSYKQDESPRYHARDVAVMRAKLEGALALLGSATPSLESYANARKGKYALVRLPERIGARGLPKVEIVDRRESLRAGTSPILTPLLLQALEARLARGEQSLLLLNRRGYATSLLCRECGGEASCPNCSVALTLHEAGRVALCHYCGYRAKAPAACSNCRGEYLKLAGHGTEKVVEAVKAALPAARVARLDRDLARRRGAAAQVLAEFERGGTDVLVGTQMIAKGHDFPRVTLVGVIDADVGLGLPDFRASERTFQLLTQVAGRAGRADLAGEVVLQSLRPEHYALRLACAQDYEGFFEREMEFRRAMGYPPESSLVNLLVRARELGEALGLARRLAEALRARARGYRVLGPALAPLARIRQEHRCQVLLKGARAPMRAAVAAAISALSPKQARSVAVDVDPVSIL
ncbi:MAG: primosomal protein N' [Vicinamibacteria bacterium]